MDRRHRALATAISALACLTGCASHSIATHWNGHTGADGKPVFVLTSKYVGFNFAIMLPWIGRTTIDEMIDESSRRLTDLHGSELRLVETESSNYWYGIPPLSWLFSPVVTSVTFEYRPSAQAIAEAAAADLPKAEQKRRAAQEHAAPAPAR